ncbi:hypothetical protein [Acidisphaera sp. S103]|uniref:hypothetical protein n=1 Tax=Acidisphaera sp. S103 TaxID=1747223 RepID=UPI00131AC72D|nr:hypothetical protein [Acidisphaera sp. S103]
MQSLQEGINERQNDLRELVNILGRKSYNMQRFSNWMRVLTIVLSAILTAKGVSDKILGADAAIPLISFTAIGIINTALLGVEAAFKFEKRSADINTMSASCQAAMIAVDSQWRKEIGSISDSDLRKAARDILTTQDKALTEAHQKAASLGIHLTIAQRELEKPDNQMPYAA